MERRALIKVLAAGVSSLYLSKLYGKARQLAPIAFTAGPFTKLGIWAHWGTQCQPEHGDWYARDMYD